MSGELEEREREAGREENKWRKEKERNEGILEKFDGKNLTNVTAVS